MNPGDTDFECEVRDFPKFMAKPSLGADSANLNLLRSVAVLAVFVAHTFTVRTGNPRLWNLGHLGVLLFFVHTSLVLMLSLERQDRSGTEFRARRFMIRRVFRIYPLSIVAVLFYFVTKVPSGFAFGSMTVGHLGTFGVLSNVALVQNLTYHDSVPAVLWSLPLEIQMYCVLPLLYIFARRFGPRGMIAAWVAAVGLGLTQLHFGHLGRLSVLGYGACFVPGVLAYSIGYRPRWRLWPLVVLGPVIAFMFVPKGVFIYKWIFCLAIGSVIPFFHEIKTRVLAVPAEFIAKYSFGIYLFHPAAVWFTFFRMPRLPFTLDFAIALAITVAASVGFYYSVERPMIGVGSSLASRLIPAKNTTPAPVVALQSAKKSVGQS